MGLSLAIISLNEAAHIERCIRSAMPVVDEIVVVDSGSTDGTQALAQQLGAKVIQQEFLGYGKQKQLAVAHCTKEWILSLDADEALSEALRQEISEAILKNDFEVYQLNRLNNYCGHWIYHSGWHPDWHIRLWKKGKANWNDVEIHERVESKQPIGRLKGKLLHYSIDSPEQHLRTIDKYTTLMAQKLMREGKQHKAYKRFISPPFHFLQTYIFKLGFLDGIAGFWVCWRSAYATYLKYKKLKALK